MGDDSVLGLESVVAFRKATASLLIGISEAWSSFRFSSTWRSSLFVGIRIGCCVRYWQLLKHRHCVWWSR